ncbi:hypothetical protein J4729_22760 [Leisingera sp. HS039]|nr:hypothetical protein [Leisingera sp. HS039]
MPVPGIGAITATSFAVAIEDPGTFSKERRRRWRWKSPYVCTGCCSQMFNCAFSGSS